MLPSKKTEKVYDFMKMNCLLYGPPKVGKTTFAASINDGDGVLFLATEKGHDSVEVYKVDINSWDAFRRTALELSKGGHDFKYLVIDIADWFYKHCEQYICKKHGVDHPNDLAYGKGASMVKDEFVRAINTINHMGYGICFISHCKEREQSTKTAKWSVMDTSLAAAPSGVITGLCDFVFYAYTNSEGKRVIRTKGTKHINAGDRTGLLPDLLPFSFNEVKKYLKPEEKKEESKNGKSANN